jgi:hypothetical protein
MQLACWRCRVDAIVEADQRYPEHLELINVDLGDTTAPHASGAWNLDRGRSWRRSAT